MVKIPNTTLFFKRLKMMMYKSQSNLENSIRDARTPQLEEIVFNTMTYRSSETVQRPEYFQHSVTDINVHIMFM